MTENFKEAQLSMIKWLNETAEESMTDIQVDEETGKTYRFDWDEAFERATEEAYDKIFDWVKDYDLSCDEQVKLEKWVKELRSDTFQKELDKLEKARKESLETPKKKVVEEDDLFLEWSKFHEIHPDIEQWEYEQKQKEIQEV